jgi:rhodanese-related sulfurtransferase
MTLSALALVLLGVTATAAARQVPDPGAALPRITLQDFKKLVDTHAVLVVDVRGDEVYRAGHIPGSISIPIDKLEQRVAELEKEKRPIVTYCG